MFLCENDILNKMKILKTCTLLCAYLFFITASFANETSDVVGNIGGDVLSSVKEEFPETYSALQNMEDGYELPAVVRCEVGDVGVELTIDKLKMDRKDIGSEGASVLLDAEAALALPFSISSSGDNIIRFEGKNISMDGSMTEEAKLYLGEKVEFTFLDNKIKLVLNGKSPSEDERCWVSFDCKGVRNGQISGDFVFDKSFVSPAEGDDPVKASFSFNLGDGFISKVKFDKKFKVANCGDFVFDVTDAIVDLSSSKNAAGFVFPLDYWDETAGAPETWSGFFLKSLVVAIPEELSFNGTPKEVKVNNLLIDDYGLTGNFMMTFQQDNSTTTDQNPGLAFSVDTIGVSIWQNELSDGMISGSAQVPFLKENENPLKLSFRGSFGYSDRFYYNINAGIKENSTFGIPFTEEAKVTINKGSYLDIGDKKGGDGFEASLCMNGSMTVESDFRLKGVKFEGLKFSTSSPHVDFDYFGLDGTVGFSFAGFGISLNELGLRKNSTASAESLLDLRIAAQLSLAQEGSWGIAVGGGFDIYSTFENREWKYKNFEVDSIKLDLDFSAFRFKGDIEYKGYSKDTNTIINSEFRGGLLLEISPLSFGVSGDVIFGRTRDEKTYFYTKAAVELPAGVMLFPPCVFAKSFMGGLYYKMNTPRKPKTGEDFQPIKFSEKDNYSYDESAGFGFMAGMGIYVAQKSLVSANANLELSLNSHWGLNFIRLYGFASFLSEMKLGDGKDDATIGVALNSIYDRPNRTFEAQLQGDINIKGGLLNGKANALLHTDPDRCHFWLGTRKQPDFLNFAKIIGAKTYFMLGEIETPLLPLNETVAAKAGITLSPAQGKEGDISQGKGFAFGVDMSVGAKISLPLDILYAGFNLSGGSDLMVVYTQNNWMGSGDIYVYADGSVGASIPWLRWCKWHPCIRKKKFSIFKGMTFATLQGSGPTPFTGRGKLNFSCSIFCIDLPSIDVSVSF